MTSWQITVNVYGIWHHSHCPNSIIAKTNKLKFTTDTTVFDWKASICAYKQPLFETVITLKNVNQ